MISLYSRCLYVALITMIIILYVNNEVRANSMNLKDPVTGFKYTEPHTEEERGDIRGMVVDGAGEAVIGAQVVINGTLISTITNVRGEFELRNIRTGTYDITVSAIGFKAVTREINITENPAEIFVVKFEDTGAEFPEILVLGKSDRIFSKVPGSATFLNSKELESIRPISGNEVFRRVPGVHVVDEEGLGMRANIGIRGLDPDRSRSVLILEDGIPVALAPYGEPELYYTPAIDRMAGVEVLKGSGQILFGPQTIGGVINYLSMNPPTEAEGKIRINAGEGGFLSTLLSYGNTEGNVGYQVNFLKKRADKVGLTGFDINDLNTKFVFKLNEKSVLSAKASVYRETSNSTYIGMTQSMYEAGDMDFVHMAPDDVLNVSRYSASFSHDYRINSKLSLKTTAFGFTTTRDWRRQDFASNGTANTPPSNWTGVTWGDESVPFGAIYMRNSTGNRNRRFEVAGVESRLTSRYTLLNTNNELKVGARYLYERAFEQRINGTKFNAGSGNITEDEIRTGRAISAYVQNQTTLTDRLSVHLGARLENFYYERNVLRGRYNGVVTDTSIVSDNTIMAVIPGIGFTYEPLNNFAVFGGVHTGFAPPRTKDAILNTGIVYDLKAEKSVNYELGVRTNLLKGLYIELTGFYMDFENQVISVSESSGGTGTDLVNGGETFHRGIETAIVADFTQLIGFTNMSLVYDINFTWVDARFKGDRFSGGESITGNKTPYAPEVFVNSSLTWETINGLFVRLTGNYIGEQFTDVINSIEPSADGQSGRLDAYTTFDATLAYKVSKWNTTFNVSVKNITDERYIVSRRPQGIRVGLPRFITAGVEYTF